MSNYTMVDLFAGIGGFRIALEPSGFKCIFTSENDPIPAEMYSVLHGADNIYGDITEINGNNVPNADVMTAGFPCQPFSRNGLTRGFEDTKGTLFFEVARLARDSRPRVILIENVMGFVYHDKYNTITTVIKTLSDLGYKVDFDILSAYDFGIPQNRDRMFMVAFLDVEEEEWSYTGNKFVPNAKKRVMELEPSVKTFNFSFPKPIEQSVQLSDFLEKDVDDSYDVNLEGLVTHIKDEIYRVRVGTKLGYQEFEAIPYQTSIDYSFFSSKTRRGRLKQNMIKTLDQGVEVAIYKGGGKFRRITPLETFRLQGFSDNTYYSLKNAGFSTNQLYRRAARSIPVPVVKAIGEQIVEKLEELDKRVM